MQIEDLKAAGYETHEWRHAEAILKSDFPEEWDDICEILKGFYVKKSDVVVGGQGKSRISKRLDKEFTNRGWREKQFLTSITVDNRHFTTPTHKVDCVKKRVALELEWSNKDPFFDRDLNNFRLLFELRAISVGVIITKSDSLRPIFESLGIWSKYGTTTTWMHKLLPRIDGGGGGGCPILVVGITEERFKENE